MEDTSRMRETIAEANRKRNEEMRTKAEGDTASLRQICALYLREKLPGGFSVTPYEQKVWGDQTELRLNVKASDGETFTLRFYVTQKSGRFMSSPSTFQPCISGSEYQRERRTFRPVYEKRKDGSYNYANMLADIERCIEYKRYQTSLRKSRDDASAASRATLKQVNASLGWVAKDYAPNTIEHEMGDFRISISSGEYSNGKVRVQVKLKDEYMDAEQASALIAKLGVLK
jgi:hypothetical protein